MNTKIYRSTTDRMIGGVCGGLGSYLAIDPVLIRLFFVLLTIAGGSGVLIYLLLWIVIPAGESGELAADATVRTGAEEIADHARSLGNDMRTSLQNRNPQTVLIIGALLVMMGLMFLVQNLHIGWLYWLNAGVLWPVLLIVGGAALIWRRTKGAVS
jgi:phage shock protein PspC (stress-responsive transcriptional regulator)/uncharacterized integral membrane protein